MDSLTDRRSVTVPQTTWVQTEIDIDLPTTPVEEDGYGRAEVLRITKVTYRQLDHWTRQGIVVPSVRSASGYGSRRLYSFRDLVAIRVLKRLTDAGVSLQNLRRAVETLRRLGEPDLASTVLVTDGHTVYQCRSGDEVIDLLQGGQVVVAIAISAAVKELRSALPTPEPAVDLAEHRENRRPRPAASTAPAPVAASRAGQ
jgi:DNA-binding transcriptional MerR regulator